MAEAVAETKNKSNWTINAISVIVPLVVIVLLSLPDKIDLGEWTKVLPHMIGAVNSVTTIVLIAGLIFIRQNKINLHRWAMIQAFGLGVVFLVLYVMHHLTNPVIKFAGEGAIRYVYFFILITHILLSLVVLPLVLRAMLYAVTAQFDRHKRIARYAYPIWLYVSATGVAVYLLVNQLFPAK